MNIGIVDVDGHNYPNLALMKISAWHKSQGDNVEWANPLFGQYDKVYMSKVFNFTPDCMDIYSCPVVRGGTGYDISNELPAEIDAMQPDYSIYDWIDKKTAYGFLTRGCPNKCPWCIVPIKEGAIRPYMDVDDIAVDGRTRLILMDNNILACEYGISQLRKIAERGYRVDFNQALDARLVTNEVAEILSRIKWIDYIRFGCDTPQQIKECQRAINLIRSHGYAGRFFLYCILHGDFSECYERIDYWHRQRDWRIHPYAQPYRNPHSKTNKQDIPQWQKDLAHWVNKHAIYEACDFSEFSPRKGFKCSAYL